MLHFSLSEMQRVTTSLIASLWEWVRILGYFLTGNYFRTVQNKNSFQEALKSHLFSSCSYTDASVFLSSLLMKVQRVTLGPTASWSWDLAIQSADLFSRAMKPHVVILRRPTRSGRRFSLRRVNCDSSHNSTGCLRSCESQCNGAPRFFLLL